MWFMLARERLDTKTSSINLLIKAEEVGHVTNWIQEASVHPCTSAALPCLKCARMLSQMRSVIHMRKPCTVFALGGGHSHISHGAGPAHRLSWTLAQSWWTPLPYPRTQLFPCWCEASLLDGSPQLSSIAQETRSKAVSLSILGLSAGKVKNSNKGIQWPAHKCVSRSCAK